jgi:hypothetical protein
MVISKLYFSSDKHTQSHIRICQKSNFPLIFDINKPLFLIFDFQQIMNSYEFKEIIVFKYFEIENGVLELKRDCYLSIVKFLDSSILRKVCVNNIFFFNFLFVFFVVRWH